MPRQRKPQPQPITVAQCDCCEQIRVVVNTGGVHWCRDDIQTTLGWRQLNEEQRAKLLQLYDAIAAKPEVRLLLEAGAKLSSDQLRSMAIGASRRRLGDAHRAEMRDGW